MNHQVKGWRKSIQAGLTRAKRSRKNRTIRCLSTQNRNYYRNQRKFNYAWKMLLRAANQNKMTKARRYYMSMAKQWKNLRSIHNKAKVCRGARLSDARVAKITTKAAKAKPKPTVMRRARVRRRKRRSRRRRPRRVGPLNIVARPPRRVAAEMAPSSPAPSPPPPPGSGGSIRRRTTISFSDSTISGALARPEGSAAVMGNRGAGGRADKKEKKKGGKAKARVWKRTRSNTILSKVSVGGGKFLQLKKFRVSVQVEGMRVRTLIDHIYYNPHNRTLQGTFKYTLPPDASVSYYAMFVGRRQRRTPTFFSGKGPAPRRLLRMQPKQIARTQVHKGWGKLREARLVAAEEGRKVYEEITRRRIDPALLEQDAPNTFTGRVFPVPAKGYNRVLLAYEETLPQLQGQHVYRFRFPPEVADMIDFTMGYNPRLSKLTRSNLKALRCRMPKKRPLVRCYWEKNKPKKDGVFYFQPKDSNLSMVGGTDPLSGQKYMVAQARVQLPNATVKQTASDAVFLLDTSLSAQPDLFAAHVKLLLNILERNKQVKRFNVAFFDIGVRWASNKGWIANTPAQRKKLFARVQTIVLEGATNLSAVMKALAKPSWLASSAAPSNVDVFVLSDGQLNWGNKHLDRILHKFNKTKRWKDVRFFAYQMGIGSENLGLFRQLVRNGGALFPCLSRSEIPRCATAHTRSSMLLQQVKVDGIDASQILVAGRQANIFPGGLITLGAQFKKNGPVKIQLIGTYQGKPFRKTLTGTIKAESDLGPRTWAELAVAQLIELDDPKQRKLIVAYSQHFHLPNKFCSFLILETDKEYKQYGLEKERKERKVQDVAVFLKKLLAAKGAPVTEKQRWIHLMRRVLKRYKTLKSSSGRAVLSMLYAMPESDFVFQELQASKLWTTQNVPKAYLKVRMKNRQQFSPFVKEAKRRMDSNMAGAVRSLSCIVELHPSNPQALRLVGYYLRAWNKPALAAGVFFRVLERRSFEPHAFRDVAISLFRMKRYALAAAMYEMIVAGSWHSRFKSIKRLAKEEYALLLHSAMGSKKLSFSMRRKLELRKSQMGLTVNRSRLRITVTWNTDNTDIDLWVTGPKGHKCYYRKKSTADGGRLLEDITRGYGPERYENKYAPKGNYHVQLQFYGHRSNVLGNETHISVMIVRNAGTSEQSVEYKNLVLRKRKQVVSVAKLKV